MDGMGIRHRLLLATTMLAITGPGCFTGSKAECRAEAQHGSEVRGTLAGVESEARAAEMPDYPRKSTITTNDVVREVVPSFDEVGFDGTTITVGFGGVGLSFRKPSSTGVTTLAALGGLVCEWRGRDDTACAAIDGAVEVVAIAEPCTKDACAGFDIRLHLPAPETAPARAFVHGEGRLLHREWEEPACVHVSNREDCLFDDCFLGVVL